MVAPEKNPTQNMSQLVCNLTLWLPEVKAQSGKGDVIPIV